MRRILTVGVLAAALSVLAFAENFTGKLVDAGCMDQQKGAAAASCDATASTTMFGIVVSGKTYKFDEAGNAKAAEALKSRTPVGQPGQPRGSPGSDYGESQWDQGRRQHHQSRQSRRTVRQQFL